MERAKQDPGAIMWIKTGGGPAHMNIGGRVRIIKPKQQFAAREDEIPLAFRDVIVPVDPVNLSAKQAKEKEVAETQAPKYSLQERGGNWWDVVNAEGKVQNERALRKPEAEKLVEDLS